MLSKSAKWELGFVHYIAKFTISRLVISRFECNFYTQKLTTLLNSESLGIEDEAADSTLDFRLLIFLARSPRFWSISASLNSLWANTTRLAIPLINVIGEIA